MLQSIGNIKVSIHHWLQDDEIRKVLEKIEDKYPHMVCLDSYDATTLSRLSFNFGNLRGFLTMLTDYCTTECLVPRFENGLQSFMNNMKIDYEYYREENLKIIYKIDTIVRLFARNDLPIINSEIEKLSQNLCNSADIVNRVINPEIRKTQKLTSIGKFRQAKTDLDAGKSIVMILNDSTNTTISAENEGNGGHWTSLNIKKNGNSYEVYFMNSNGSTQISNKDAIKNLIRRIHNIGLIEEKLLAICPKYIEEIADINTNKAKLMYKINELLKIMPVDINLIGKIYEKLQELRKKKSSNADAEIKIDTKTTYPEGQIFFSNLLEYDEKDSIIKVILDYCNVTDEVKNKAQEVLDFYKNSNIKKEKQIYDNMFSETDAATNEVDVDIKFPDIKGLAKQNDGSLCGVASLLNALTLGLGYKLNKNAEFSCGGVDVIMARVLVELVGRGSITIEEMIAVFLTHPEMPVCKNNVTFTLPEGQTTLPTYSKGLEEFLKVSVNFNLKNPEEIHVPSDTITDDSDDEHNSFEKYFNKLAEYLGLEEDTLVEIFWHVIISCVFTGLGVMGIFYISPIISYTQFICIAYASYFSAGIIMNNLANDKTFENKAQYPHVYSNKYGNFRDIRNEIDVQIQNLHSTHNKS